MLGCTVVVVLLWSLVSCGATWCLQQRGSDCLHARCSECHGCAHCNATSISFLPSYPPPPNSPPPPSSSATPSVSPPPLYEPPTSTSAVERRWESTIQPSAPPPPLPPPRRQLRLGNTLQSVLDTALVALAVFAASCAVFLLLLLLRCGRTRARGRFGHPSSHRGTSRGVRTPMELRAFPPPSSRVVRTSLAPIPAGLPPSSIPRELPTYRDEARSAPTSPPRLPLSGTTIRPVLDESSTSDSPRANTPLVYAAIHLDFHAAESQAF